MSRDFFYKLKDPCTSGLQACTPGSVGDFLLLSWVGCNSILESSVLEFVCCSKLCPGFQNRRIWLSPLDLHPALGLSELAFPICRMGMMLTFRFQRCGDTLPITSHLYLVKP